MGLAKEYSVLSLYYALVYPCRRVKLAFIVESENWVLFVYLCGYYFYRRSGRPCSKMGDYVLFSTGSSALGTGLKNMLFF